MEHIKVETPILTVKTQIDFATEIAYQKFYDTLVKFGLTLEPTMGLIYLPDESVTEKFKEGCRAVANLLIVKEQDETV